MTCLGGADTSVDPDQFDDADGISLPSTGMVYAEVRSADGSAPVRFPVYLDKSVRVGQIASDAYFVLVGLANLVARAANEHVSIDVNTGITVFKMGSAIIARAGAPDENPATAPRVRPKKTPKPRPTK